MERRLKAHKAALGPVDGRAAHANAGHDVAGASVGSQQNLRPLERARRVLASPQKHREFAAGLG